MSLEDKMPRNCGLWIITDNPYVRPICSICEEESWDDVTDKLTPFCPKCGAQMLGATRITDVYKPIKEEFTF